MKTPTQKKQLRDKSCFNGGREEQSLFWMFNRWIAEEMSRINVFFMRLVGHTVSFKQS